MNISLKTRVVRREADVSSVCFLSVPHAGRSVTGVHFLYDHPTVRLATRLRESTIPLTSPILRPWLNYRFHINRVFGMLASLQDKQRLRSPRRAHLRRLLRRQKGGPRPSPRAQGKTRSVRAHIFRRGMTTCILIH